jgi:hypothetical protein
MPAIALQHTGAGPGEAEPYLSHWGEKVGYAPASREQMQKLVALPLLGLAATPLLIKNLSAASLPKVRPICPMTPEQCQRKYDCVVRISALRHSAVNILFTSGRPSLMLCPLSLLLRSASRVYGFLTSAFSF